MSNRKAYGYPLTPDHDNCFGIVVSEDGKFLGTHTSSSYSWLKSDLKSKAKGYDYEFIYYIPGIRFVIPILLNEIDRLKNELKGLKYD